jgi:hypothetical protein
MTVGDEQPEVRVRVGVQQVIDQLHAKYGRQLAMVVQENAEAQATIDELTRQLAEAQSLVRAFEGIEGVPDENPAGQDLSLPQMD